MRYYVLLIWEDVEPDLYGPYTKAIRDRTARELKKEHGNRSGIFALDSSASGKLTVSSYVRAFFEEGGEDLR